MCWCHLYGFRGETEAPRRRGPVGLSQFRSRPKVTRSGEASTGDKPGFDPNDTMTSLGRQSKRHETGEETGQGRGRMGSL